MLSTISGMLSVFLLSLLLGNCVAGITFLLVFVGLRLFSGGYHATTYLRCFVLSNCMFLMGYGLSVLIQPFSFLQWSLATVSIGIIFFLSPVRHKKHPLSELAYRRNGSIARFLAISILLFFGGCMFSNEFPLVAANTAASLAAVASLILLATYLERGETL